MRLSKSLQTIFCFILLVIPIITFADPVPWTTEQYTANAYYANLSGSPVYGPPLPISDSFSWSVYPLNQSASTVTSTYMDVWSTGITTDFNIWAEASFSGSYFATNATPLFQFTYSGYFTSENPGWGGAYSERYAWFQVDDLTTSTLLYTNPSLTLDSSTNIIEVPTIAGHEILVSFGAYTKSNSDGLTGDNYEAVRLNYSTAVVPEPISSTLFMVGGTVLGLRRFRRNLRNRFVRK